MTKHYSILIVALLLSFTMMILPATADAADPEEAVANVEAAIVDAMAKSSSGNGPTLAQLGGVQGGSTNSDASGGAGGESSGDGGSGGGGASGSQGGD